MKTQSKGQRPKSKLRPPARLGPKSEIRILEIRSPKMASVPRFKNRIVNLFAPPAVRASGFGFLSVFGFRASDFGFNEIGLWTLAFGLETLAE